MSDDRKLPESAFSAADWEEGTELKGRPLTVGEKEPEPGNGGGVIAGAALAWTVLKDLLALMNSPRRIAIAVHNYPQLPLTEPKFVCCGGGLESADLEVAGNHAGFVSAQKTAIFQGTFGVVSYRIGASKDRLAVMWSIPDNRNFYENWFKMGIIANGTPTDSTLFNDMYYDKGKLTTGKAAAARSGSQSWTSAGYALSGVMGTTDITTLNTSLKKA